MDVTPNRTKYIVFGLGKTRTSRQGVSLPLWSHENWSFERVGLISCINKAKDTGDVRAI
ncbi:MAG: hypothetical protein K0Q59_5473 [Paenibacillus sp.]|jgi:hypothetical protein|nr:hypothetical protein [Paenibacillus sp.]